MDVRIPKVKYVVAVSGGVDSVVLLDLLSNLDGVELVVAHFNHGIRADSVKDETFVQDLAKKYGLAFEAGHGNLGAGASEDKARKARYRFLNQVKQQHHADAVITAHHQDDLLETAIINIIRGSGRRGLTAISDNPGIVRPLLTYAKEDILGYAKEKRLGWREDPSNEDETYLRNYVRRIILPKLSANQRQQLLQNIDDLKRVNAILNQEIAKLSHKIVNDNAIDREKFIALPVDIAREVLMAFLRDNGLGEFDRPAIERLLAAIKTSKTGTRHDVLRGWYLEITASKALLRTTVNR